MTQANNVAIESSQINSSGILQPAGGGTGLSAIGTAGQVLTVNSGATALQYSTPAAATTFSAGTTGFTPNTATSGAVTLAGTLAIANGGTGSTTAATVAGTGISVSGTFPNQTVTNSGVTSIVAGTGISISGATGAVTVTNSSSVNASQLAKVWCNWDSGASIRASYNVSSISKNGTGNWTVNFSSSLTDGSYAVAAGGGDYAGGDLIAVGVASVGAQTASSCQVFSGLTGGGGGRRDSNIMCITCFR
jgi:hypothetical protein